MENQFLVYIDTNFEGGLSVFKDKLNNLKENFQLEKLSNVYRFTDSQGAEKLCMSLRASTPLDLPQVEQKLLRIVTGFQLVLFGQQIMMAPERTLPHPELRSNPLMLMVAIEAWPDYLHPLYKKNLKDLPVISSTSEQAEFLTQGKSLVDF